MNKSIEQFAKDLFDATELVCGGNGRSNPKATGRRAWIYVAELGESDYSLSDIFKVYASKTFDETRLRTATDLLTMAKSYRKNILGKKNI